MISEGDIVLVDYTRIDPAAGRRAAVVVQNDRDNARLQKTIVVQITGNTTRAGEATQLLLDPSDPDWAQTGLRLASVVNCLNIHTVEWADIVVGLGFLSPVAVQQVDECLRAALDLL